MTPALSRSLAVLVFFLVCSPALAQQAARATLTGTVTDPAGAVIAGATVITTDKASSIRRETLTNDQGLYVFSDMLPGEYELRVEAKSFNPNVSKVPVPLKVGQAVTLNVQLSVNSNDPNIICILIITGDVPLIDNTASAVQGVIDSREVQSLPLNGRNFLELALLVPGNAPAPNFDPTKTNTVVISSAGQLGRAGNVTID